MMSREAIMMMRVCDDDWDRETVDAHHHGLVPPDLPPLIMMMVSCVVGWSHSEEGETYFYISNRFYVINIIN